MIPPPPTAASNGSAAIRISHLPKSPTGIKGLDEILDGGLPKNRPTLLVGDIGCGKTFLALEYVANGIEKFHENGVFMSFEEKTDELIQNVSNLGYGIEKMVADGQLYFEHLEIHHHLTKEAGAYKIDGLFSHLEDAIDKVSAKRVVLDSLDTLFAELEVHHLRSEFKRLFQWLKEKKVTSIVTAEIGNEFITKLGLEELVADCVIELNNRVESQVAVRRIRVLKYRGSTHGINEYPFIIDENRISVFPLISQGMEQATSSEKISSGIHDLDLLLDGNGFFKGSSILISGTAGTGKTSILASFTNAVCHSGKAVLYCAFEESPLQLVRNMHSIGIHLDHHLANKTLEFYYARPSLQNLELHFMAIREKIAQLNCSVVVLDPITNLMTEGPNSDVRSMLIRMVDFLKYKQITVMFSAAITVGSIERNPSDEGISSMVDTWVMLEDLAIDFNRATKIFVMKSRGMKHSRELRWLNMTPEGLGLSSENMVSPIVLQHEHA